MDAELCGVALQTAMTSLQNLRGEARGELGCEVEIKLILQNEMLGVTVFARDRGTSFSAGEEFWFAIQPGENLDRIRQELGARFDRAVRSLARRRKRAD
jgi:hypothetical protein